MRQSPPPHLLIGLLLVSAVLAFPGPIRHAAVTMFRLPFRIVAGSAWIVLTLPRLPSLEAENTHLRAELIRQQLTIAQLREALRRQEAAQVLRNADPASAGIVAQVIGRSLVPTQQTILLNKGQQDGLMLESIVVNTDGLVGRAIEVGASTTLVMLLTDPESRVAGLVERSRETGLLIGRGLGSCELVYLDADADVQAGDRLVTAGLGHTFPKGLLLGSVTRVVRDTVSGTASAVVKPAARGGQVEDVLCLLTGPSAGEGLSAASLVTRQTGRASRQVPRSQAVESRDR